MTKAMVLAAGVGSRLEPISHHIPKPLVPVLNKPVITHILSLLKQHGFTDVIANTHYLSECLTDYFEQNPLPGLRLQFRYEQELTGDAGGARACREFFDAGTFIVIMGDLATNANLTRLLEAHKKKGALATIAVKKMKDVTRFGVMKRDENGFITAFQEKPKAEEAISNEISTGIYVLEPEIFNYIPSAGVYGFGRQLFPTLVEKGLPILGEEIDGYWSDIGTLNDLFRANMDALTGLFPVQRIEAPSASNYPGVTIKDNVLIGNNVQIGKGSSICENSIIGDGCKIGESVSIQNSLIFANSSINAGDTMHNCISAFNEIIPVET